MVEVVNRLVKKTGKFILSPLLLIGCQSAPPPAGPDAAALSCPEVTSAEAWVNRMPGVGNVSSKLIVSLKLEDDNLWMLVPTPQQDETVMSLDLVPGGNSLPGYAVLTKQAKSPMMDAIEIACGGTVVSRIDSILVVQ